MISLSIIVPVYNKSKYINTCVDSILAQSLNDFELILVDDGSTDDSGLKCDNYKRADERITVIHQRNMGVHSARNAGLKIAKGKYIGFVDSDDLLDFDMYELLMYNAIKYQADISMCGVRRISPDRTQLFGGKEQITLYTKDQGITALLTGNMMLSVYDKIYLHAAVKGIYFEPALFEDTYYNFEALKVVNCSVYDSRIKYNYMIRDNSESMAAFNQKYMNVMGFTKRMLNSCFREMPQHIEEAKSFDFNTNMMILNLIIIDSRNKNFNDYQIVKKNLTYYSKIYRKIAGVTTRYRYGYFIYSLSERLYAIILRIYSNYTNSEHLSRKKKLTN